VEYLRKQPGVTVQGDPETIEDGGPIHGDRWVYFQTPWGMQMEVLHMPKGMPYEQHTSARLYGPAPSWDAQPSPSATLNGGASHPSPGGEAQ